MKHMYHLNLDENQVTNIKYAILPGDPDRVAHIASHLENSRELARKREYCSYTGMLNGTPVIVTSTGIGDASTSIAVEELAMLGIHTFVRIGTSSAIQPHINVGSVMISTGAVRLDGASFHIAPPEYPAVAHYEVVQSLMDGANELNIEHHAGITASSSTFYQGQERYDTYKKYVIRRFAGSLSEWQSLGVMNYEMESATLFTQTSVMGLRAGCICTAIANRCHTEHVDLSIIKSCESTVIKATLKGISILIDRDHKK